MVLIADVKKAKNIDDNIVIGFEKKFAPRRRVERDFLPFSESLISAMTTKIPQSSSLIVARIGFSMFLRSLLMRLLNSPQMNHHF